MKPLMRSGVKKTPKVVIDTQVLLRAEFNRRSLPAEIVYDLIDNYVLLVSEATLKEIENVLSRPKVRNKFALTDAIVQELMSRLSKGLRVVVDDVPPVSRDPTHYTFLTCPASASSTTI